MPREMVERYQGSVSYEEIMEDAANALGLDLDEVTITGAFEFIHDVPVLISTPIPESESKYQVIEQAARERGMQTPMEAGLRPGDAFLIVGNLTGGYGQSSAPQSSDILLAKVTNPFREDANYLSIESVWLTVVPHSTGKFYVQSRSPEIRATERRIPRSVGQVFPLKFSQV